MAVASETIAPPRSSRVRRYNTLSFWGMVGPLVLGLLAFTYVPIVWGFLLSVFDSRAPSS